MTIQTESISKATDVHQSMATLLNAFATDPAARWMYPDSQQYQRCFPEFIRAFAGRAFGHGTAFAAAGGAAVALWLPPEVFPDDEAIAGVVNQSVPEERREEVFSLMEQMGAYHPSSAHWYLPLIGVRSEAQNRGCGSALLREALAQCDQDGRTAYLESSSPRNIPLYERFGFRAIGRIQTRTSPPIVPMLREAQ